jgi:VanZ family protein
MITRILLVLKKYALIIAIVYTLLVAFVSFMSLSAFQDLSLITHQDKIVHVLMYLFFAFFWYNYLETYTDKALLIGISLAAIFGTIVEVLQGSLTAERQFDYYDISANIVGALTSIILVKRLKKRVKKI